MIKVLLVTNDAVLERMLMVTLMINGLTVVPVNFMCEITAALTAEDYNMFILDEEFADMCPIIREKGFDVPMLVLGNPLLKEVKNTSNLAKPFAFPELKKTMNEIFRKNRPTVEKILEFGDIKVDVAKSAVVIKDKIVNLGKMELAIFISLLKKTGKIVSKERMRMDMEKQGHFFNTTIFHHIKELKRKIKEVSAENLHIKSVTGEGYQLVLD